jgi:plastocyanin
METQNKGRSPGEPPPRPQPITIQVDDRGNFTYTPAVRRAAPGEPVSWSCNDPFVVHFARQSPFDRVEFRPSLKGEGLPPYSTELATSRPGVQPGGYHYVVAVERDGTVFVDGGCPEIVISP